MSTASDCRDCVWQAPCTTGPGSFAAPGGRQRRAARGGEVRPRLTTWYPKRGKYLKRGEAADEAAVAARLRLARTQYLADARLRRRQPAVRHIGLAVVFRGWELAAREAVGDEDDGD